MGTIGMYAHSLHKLKQHQKNNKHLSPNGRSVVKIGSIYLLIILISFTPALFIQMLYEVILKTHNGEWLLGVLLPASIMWANCGSLANAVVFLMANAEAKDFIKEHWDGWVFWRRNRVQVIEPRSIFVLENVENRSTEAEHLSF